MTVASDEHSQVIIFNDHSREMKKLETEAEAEAEAGGINVGNSLPSLI